MAVVPFVGGPPSQLLRLDLAATWQEVSWADWARVISIHNEDQQDGVLWAWITTNGDGGAVTGADAARYGVVRPSGDQNNIPVTSGRAQNTVRTRLFIAAQSGTPTVWLEIEEAVRG